MYRYKIGDIKVSSGEAQEMDFDWRKCIICQQRTSVPLKCPLDSCRQQNGANF